MSAIDRLVRRLSSAYRREQGSNNYKLLSIPAQELDQLEQEMQNVLSAHHVDTATGKSLDRIGELVMVRRNPGESDTDYRNRIKSEWPARASDSTKQAIIYALTTILGVSETKLNIVEDFANSPAHFKLEVASDVSDKESKIIEIVNRTKAAGVSWELFWLGSKWDVGTWDNAVWGS